MEWILIALVPAVVWSFAVLCDKILVSRFIKDGIIAGILTNISSSIIVLLLALFCPIAYLPLNAILLILLAGALWGWSRIFFVKGISLDEATRVVAIGNVSPVIILLGSALFFGEALTGAHFLAFALIFAGIIWVSLRKSKGALHLSPAMLWMLLSAILFAASTLLLKGRGMDDWWTVLFWLNLGFGLGSVPLLAKRSYFSGARRAFSRNAFALLGMLLLINAFTLSGRAAYFVALGLGPAALVSVLASLQTAIVFIIALLLSLYAPSIIKEECTLRIFINKLGAIIIILLGIALLYLG